MVDIMEDFLDKLSEFFGLVCTIGLVGLFFVGLLSLYFLVLPLIAGWIIVSILALFGYKFSVWVGFWIVWGIRIVKWLT